MPTREQLIQNIQAMEKQGAPQADIQAYLDGLKKSQKTVQQETSVVPQVDEVKQDAPTSAPFPSTGDEAPISAALKTAGNMPSSAINFTKGTVETLNPIETGKKLAEYFKGFGEFSKELGDDPSAASLKVLKEVPGQAYKMLVPQFVQSLFKGDTVGAQKSIVEDPFGQIAPLVIAAKAIAEGAGHGAQFDAAMTK